MINTKQMQNELLDIEEKVRRTQLIKEQEEAFKDVANNRFNKNLAAFKEFFPNIAISIESYQSPEPLKLYVTSSGHANVKTNVEGVPFYSDDPIKQTEAQVKSAISNPVFTLSDYSSYDPNSTDDRIHIRYMNKLGGLLKEDREISQRNALAQLPRRFPSAMIFGVGLGYHIPILLENSSFDFTFIIEPDFEKFYLSLFCIDWAELIEKINAESGCLFLFVGIKSHELVTELRKITEDIGAFSLVRSFCFQHTPMPEINALIQEFFNEYFQFQFGHGFYNDAVTGLAHTYHHLRKNIPVYDAKTPVFNESLKVPAIVVGNGPSLDEAREFIESNQGNCIVFACGTALNSLLKMGITPDFHVLVERPYRNYQALEKIATREEYKKLNLLSINTLYPDSNDLYKWSGLALKGNEAATDFLQIYNYLKNGQILKEITFCNPLVANTGLAFAIHFGFQEIYLCGVDNGNSICGKHHSEVSLYDKNDKSEIHFHPQGSDGSQLQGNLESVVDSNPTYRVSNKQLEELLRVHPRTVYNVGSGAKIKGAMPTDPELLLDLPLVDKPKIEYVNAIKSSFKNLGLDFVNESSINVSAIDEIFEHLLEITRENYDCVEDVAEILKRQQRYIYAFRGTQLSHAFHLIKGSLLYYHCPLVTNLFKFEPKDALELYFKINTLWQDYLTEMKAHFCSNATKKCDWSF